MHSHLKKALKRSQAHEYDEGVDYHLCAIIMRGASLISVGYNQRSTNAFVEHYTDRVRGTGRGYSLSTHAEMDAVAKARAKTDLTGTKIYVARLRVDGLVGMARPCEICQEVLRSYGVKRAIYTINDFEFGVMNLSRDTDDQIVTI